MCQNPLEQSSQRGVCAAFKSHPKPQFKPAMSCQVPPSDHGSELLSNAITTLGTLRLWDSLGKEITACSFDELFHPLQEDHKQNRNLVTRKTHKYLQTQSCGYKNWESQQDGTLSRFQEQNECR